MGNQETKRYPKGIEIKTRDKKQFDVVMNLKKDIYLAVNGTERKANVEEITSKNISKGIVFERSWLQLSEDEITQELRLSGHDVREVKNLTKNERDGNKTNTNGFVITFNDVELSERVKFGGLHYKVRQYYPFPLVCGKCLRFNHKIASCDQQFWTCRKCGSGKGECHICVSTQCPNCPNGENSHEPNGNACPAMKTKKMIVKYKIDNRVSFTTAMMRVDGERNVQKERPTRSLH